ARETRDVAGTEGLEALAQEPGCEATGPLVEVADHEAGPFHIGTRENAAVDQQAALIAPLHVAGAEMHIEDVERGLIRHFDFSLEDAAPFAPVPRDIEILPS